MQNQNKLIDQFHKNSQELVEVHISEWKAQDYIDIRIWTIPDLTEPGTQQPTKKGICINAELLPKLMKALEKAGKTLEKGQDEAELGPEIAQDKRSPQGEYQSMGREHPDKGISPDSAKKQGSHFDSERRSQEEEG